MPGIITDSSEFWYFHSRFYLNMFHIHQCQNRSDFFLIDSQSVLLLIHVKWKMLTFASSLTPCINLTFISKAFFRLHIFCFGKCHCLGLILIVIVADRTSRSTERLCSARKTLFHSDVFSKNLTRFVQKLRCSAMTTEISWCVFAT